MPFGRSWLDGYDPPPHLHLAPRRCRSDCPPLHSAGACRPVLFAPPGGLCARLQRQTSSANYPDQYPMMSAETLQPEPGSPAVASTPGPGADGQLGPRCDTRQCSNTRQHTTVLQPPSFRHPWATRAQHPIPPANLRCGHLNRPAALWQGAHGRGELRVPVHRPGDRGCAISALITLLADAPSCPSYQDLCALLLLLLFGKWVRSGRPMIWACTLSGRRRVRGTTWQCLRVDTVRPSR